MFKFIRNIGDYFSSNYFDEDFSTKVLSKCGYGADAIREFNKRITPIKDRFFRYKQLYIEGKLRTKDKIKETHQFHTHLLNALGYEGNKTNYNDLFHFSEDEAIPVRHILHRGEQPHLMIMEMQALIKEDDNEPDGLFEQRYNVEDEAQANPPQRYHRSQWDDVFKVPEGVKISPVIINKAISQLFLLEPHHRPKYILLLSGNVLFLLEQEKWFRGSYLELDLEELFTEATASPRANYYALFYFLASKEALAPESNIVLLDQLDEDSHKSAYEVTKDLKEGIIHAIEALANETLYYQKQVLQKDFDETDDQFEQEIKDDCLRIVYRMLFIFYAESREDLDILPSNDPMYNKGYSLEMLRDLEQVPLYSETSLNGYFFHESLTTLFHLLSSGYRERENGNNKSFKVRHIDSPIFDDRKLHHLHEVKFRNRVWQDIICRLSLSKQQRNRSRGRISYANLGINQLGSVYESLLAYRGFYAEQDYIEVHKKDKPDEGTYLVPRSRRDDFEEGEILKDSNDEDIILKKGSFVYRLSGRDRQKSASYYTPEVLTQTTVKYTLKPILERLEKAEMKAAELLDLKLLEPAMGAAAFQNEMINQIAEAYLSYRQKELRDAGRIEWKVEPDKYKEELQKVKAYIATHNTYGVDLNPTAIELGKLSLWLNVIHKDMETPFFSNRICVGNAVVGAWLKVYKEKDIAEEADTRGITLKKQPIKEWWETAPRQLEFKPQDSYEKIKHGRKQDEIYHFLLPDKNMVPSAGIKMLKAEYTAEAKRVADWKKEWCKPISITEMHTLKAICNKIDELLTEYYRFQRIINQQTSSKEAIFGVPVKQLSVALKSYDEKERLDDQRNRHSAPYFKLKMVMDYWCSLWFWDVRQAGQLPDRKQYWQDITSILELDAAKALDGIVIRKGQQGLFETTTQLSMAIASENAGVKSETIIAEFAEVVVEYTNRKDLFDNNQRLSIVSELARKNWFFHPQLEFLEVFWERGGFDLISGNPPWIKLTFEEKDILGESSPEILVRKTSASYLKNIREGYLSSSEMASIYFLAMKETECTSSFLGATQNYHLLKGQAVNLYKCIIGNCLNLLSNNGYAGLLHPESIYDDPSGGALRGEIFYRLKFHFQFQNAQNLFAEVAHREKYSINIYSGKKDSISFITISNIFHPSLIDGCFIHDGHGVCEGLKIKIGSEFTWNIQPHKDRLIHIKEKELQTLAMVFDNSKDIKDAKLVSIHSQQIYNVIKRFSEIKTRVCDIPFFVSECWNETAAQDKGIIKRTTSTPDYQNYEVILSGPHFYVATPYYKTPREICVEKADYDIIDLNEIDESYLPRTNYLPNEKLTEFTNRIVWESNSKKWIDDYRIIFSRRLSVPGERTLQPAIVPPKVSFVNTVTSVLFKETDSLLDFAATCSSIIIDFYIKSIGKGDLYDATISGLPMLSDLKFSSKLRSRILGLNSLNKYYRQLWEDNYQDAFSQDTWSKQDVRLKPFSTLTSNWQWSTALRNYFERRQALVEIDVITAIAFGLKLQELILIYNVQFPVLQQNEDDTWYDTTGNIVFTCSKGLVGVGVDRPVWEQIRSLKAGEIYEHTITKSELYYGKKIIYHAPFDKCDRVEDYKIAWAHFEKVFENTLS